ncbi:MAG: hypothetical protein H6885_04370 [Rhodobiaceae bacterium]|nr:hypothetical protein [Rhodobiaceae bacterium]
MDRLFKRLSDFLRGAYFYDAVNPVRDHVRLFARQLLPQSIGVDFLQDVEIVDDEQPRYIVQNAREDCRTAARLANDEYRGFGSVFHVNRGNHVDASQSWISAAGFG